MVQHSLNHTVREGFPMRQEKNLPYPTENKESLSFLLRDAAKALGYNVVPDTPWVDKSRETATELEGEKALVDMETIVSALADAVLVFDSTSRLRFLNGTAERFFGHPSDSLANNLFYKPVLWQIEENGKPSKPFTKECLSQVIKDARSLVTEVVNLHNPDNPQWFLANLTPIFEDEKTPKGVVLALTDITILKKKEERHTASLKEIFNELNTPLTILRGHAQILAEDIRSPSSHPPSEEQIDAILSSIDRMEQIFIDLIKHNGKSA